MKKASLVNTNPYLKGQNRAALAARSTITSCGVEGVKVDLLKALAIIIPRRPKRILSDSKK
ncbi:MAG: hypothetical protein A2X77_03995 [Gammaproteobacteria bacterium GWE2_42_36]|nr:MAG: hypothetical protein A2X77_03995 [Gammaproteobacteria bacterium GWE2_42_36]HCU05000.1 hypothetical protein [Coxiellaceae bacterium]